MCMGFVGGGVVDADVDDVGVGVSVSVVVAVIAPDVVVAVVVEQTMVVVDAGIMVEVAADESVVKDDVVPPMPMISHIESNRYTPFPINVMNTQFVPRILFPIN